MIRPQASVRPDPWKTKNNWLVASAVVVMLPLIGEVAGMGAVGKISHDHEVTGGSPAA